MTRGKDARAICVRRRQPVWVCSKLLLTFGLLIIPGLMAAGKVSRDLQTAPPAGVVDVIVQFKNPPSAADVTSIVRLGGKQKKSFPKIRGGLYTLPTAALQALSANPNVTYISPDRKLAGSLEFAGPTVGAGIALQYGWDGSGVG